MIHADKNKYFWQIFILAHIRNKLIIKNFKIVGIYVILCRPSFRSSQGPSHMQHHKSFFYAGSTYKSISTGNAAPSSVPGETRR